MNLYKKYLNTYKVPFFIAIFCVACEAVCDLLGPTLMSNIINTGIEQGSLSRVYYWGFLMLAVTLTGACFAITRSILSSRVSQRIGADLRYDLFQKIVSFSEVSSDQIESGSLITRMTNDTAQITQFVNGIMRIFLKAPITCIGSMILATLLNVRLSLIIYGVVAIVTLLIMISMKLSYPRFSKLQDAMDKMNADVQEYLIGVRLVKAFGTYDRETDKFEDSNGNLMKMGVSSQMVITLISPFITLTVGIGTVVVIFVGSRMFAQSFASPGEISAFTIYMAQILTSLIMITNIFNTFVRTKASNQRIMEVFQCDSDFEHLGSKTRLDGTMEFQHVTFSYPNGSGVPAIRDLSFSLESGQHLAIIGPTGSGKSTIVWLLLRFYDSNHGKILLDGHEIQELDIDTVRGNIAVVPQKPMLFSGTIAENIRWGNKEASYDGMKEAVEMAQADFVLAMQEGYDSSIGSGGVNLSGGQKQRISLARGIIRNSAFLILDDATSALDAVTEAKVLKNLSESPEKQTVITITQRCGTAMAADKILVLDNGMKVGFGTHDELMRSCEMYQDIYRTQIESSRERKGGAAHESAIR